MEYLLEINGSTYNLPKYTKAINSNLVEITKNNENPNIQDEYKHKRMYDFICRTIGNENAAELFGSSSFDDIDYNEISICFIKICVAYEKPLNDVRVEVNQSKISPEDRKLVSDLFKNAGNIAELSRSAVTNRSVSYGAIR